MHARQMEYNESTALLAFCERAPVHPLSCMLSATEKQT